MNKLGIAIVLLMLACVCLPAQIATGGSYTLDQAVIANGGGATNTVGNYQIAGTAGQSVAGGIAATGPYNIRSGFWQGAVLAPTAAMVSVSGRAVTQDGAAIRNARITVDGGALTSPISVLTNAFGYFSVEVPSGQSYVVSVQHRQYQFGQPAQFVFAVDTVTDLVFTSTWRN